MVRSTLLPSELCQVADLLLGRFYAGAPIISPNGHNIGVFCVLDDKPRHQGLAPTEVDFMKDMAKTVMGHLEMVRATAELGRSQNMVQGLGQFVDGKASLKDWWTNVSHGQPARSQSRPARVRGSRAEARSSTASARHLRPTLASSDFPDTSPTPPLLPHQSTDSSSSQHSRSLSFTDAKSTSAPAFHEKAQVGSQLQEDLIDPEIKSTFQRAADIVRESVNVDGAIFLDASIGSFAGLVDGTQQHQTSCAESSAATSSSSTATNESVKILDDKQCIVLGGSLDEKRSDPHSLGASPPLPVSERFLQTLLAKYPRGKIWNYDDDDDGTMGEGLVDSPRTAAFVNRRGERWRERRILEKLFPGVRSIAFVGMWDPHRSRWFAGSMIWTCSPTRILSFEAELNYMIAFGQSVMSEIARIDVKMADKAKATFISSISHELRTPLHGIMGSSECLQGTPLDAFQSGLISTIDTCGRNLLDTFENLLSFAKINNLTNSSNFRRPSVPSSRNESSQSSVQSAVDLSILAEEVVDTAFAGHEFVRVTPLKSGLVTDGVVPAQLTAHAAKGLEAINVLLDYDTTANWVFATQSGGWIRVILNLCGNALKYTEKGHVIIRLDSRPLPNPTSKKDVEITLTVTDSGRGMSEDFLSQSVFSPFVQEDPLSPGTGLGLSIVKQIISSMGGDIYVSSKKDEGTQFRVVVCMERASLSEESHKAPPLPAVAGMLRNKRLNMILPGGEQDETNFADICSRWFGTSIRCTSEPEEADIYIISKKHANSVVTELSRPTSSNPMVSKPIIVLCKDLVSAQALQSSTCVAAVGSYMEFMPQPLAPNKVARTLLQCLERKPSPSDSNTATPTRPASPAVRMMAHRPRSRRVNSNISNESTSSNPEVVVYTPMEEKTQDALILKVCESDEANRKADVLDAQKQALMSRVPNTQPTTPGISVLLVDDNSINLNLLATFMKKQRHAYDTAVNGLEAFQAYQTASNPTHLPGDGDRPCLVQRTTPLKAWAYDFVLMDINMPVMDGLESTRQIRAFERTKGLRPATIVALTGLASASAQQEAFASGVDVFLTKPVRLKELTKIFAEHSKQA